MTIETNNAAAIAFMQKLQGLDLNDLDSGLKAMSVEAANIFPMIADDETSADRDGGNGMATRRAMLQSSIFRIDPKEKGDLPALSLEQHVIIDGEGRIVDGRNRVAAVIRNAGALPLIDYAALAAEPSQIGIKYREILSAKPGAMAMLEIAAGKTAAAFNDADLLFRHVSVEADSDAAQFTRVMNLNMARRDLTTSQRGCVAANFSQATAKKFGFGAKPTDGSIADSFGISPKTVKRAKAIRKFRKALFEEVLDGRITLGRAEIEMKRAQAPEIDPEAVAPKAKTKASVDGATATVVYNEIALKGALANKSISNAVLFDALMDGLTARFGADTPAFDAVEAGLAKLCGIDLAGKDEGEGEKA